MVAEPCPWWPSRARGGRVVAAELTPVEAVEAVGAVGPSRVSWPGSGRGARSARAGRAVATDLAPSWPSPWPGLWLNYPSRLLPVVIIV